MSPLFWYHSENSQLYSVDMYGKPGFIPPTLSDPGNLQKSCPARFLGILNKYLCNEGLKTLHENAYESSSKEIIGYLKKLPIKKYVPRRYIQARLKVLLYQILGVKLT
jgi:hypothetical protein